MYLKSSEIVRILKEIDDARYDLHSDVIRFKNRDDEDGRLIARMAHSRLLGVYLELMDVIELIEELEDREE